MELVTKDQIAARWECTPAGVDFAVRSGFLPAGVEIMGDECWDMDDVLNHELRTNLEIPEAIRTLADSRRNEPDYTALEVFKAATLANIICVFAGKPYFSDMVQVFNEATGEVNV